MTCRRSCSIFWREWHKALPCASEHSSDMAELHHTVFRASAGQLETSKTAPGAGSVGECLPPPRHAHVQLLLGVFETALQIDALLLFQRFVHYRGLLPRHVLNHHRAHKRV